MAITRASDSSSGLHHIPSTSKASWLAVGSLAISTSASVTTEFMSVGLLPNIATGLGVSEGTAGLMVTVPAVVATFAGPILITFANRLDRRAVLLILSTLLVASNVIAAVSPNIVLMLFARSLLDLCVGGFWTLAPGVAGHLVPSGLVARAMSYIMAGISAATVCRVHVSCDRVRLRQTSHSLVQRYATKPNLNSASRERDYCTAKG